MKNTIRLWLSVIILVPNLAFASLFEVSFSGEFFLDGATFAGSFTFDDAAAGPPPFVIPGAASSGVGLGCLDTPSTVFDICDPAGDMVFVPSGVALMAPQDYEIAILADPLAVSLTTFPVFFQNDVPDSPFNPFYAGFETTLLIDLFSGFDPLGGDVFATEIQCLLPLEGGCNPPGDPVFARTGLGSYTVTAVPTPAPIALIALTMLGFAARRWRAG